MNRILFALYDRLLPNPLRNSIDRAIELRNLNRLAAASCDASALAREAPKLAAEEGEWRQVKAAVEKFGLSDKPGAVNYGDRRAIYELARAMRARSILEVGTHLGASTTMLALALKQNGGGRFVTVDVRDVNGPKGAWAQYQTPTPKSMTDALGVPVEYVTRQSVDYLARCEEKFDFVFLDGGHEATTVYREVPLALKLLKPGALILLHDVYPGAKPLWSDGVVVSGPWLALTRFEAEGAKIHADPLGALPWPTKLGSNVTSLAVLTAR
jgi:predicted O-methyltransferase YrrM